MYYTYMIRCKDNSIYTGITTNLEKRMQEHFTKDEKCAKYTKYSPILWDMAASKYTKKHTAIRLERAWKSENRVFASKLEYWIKHLSKLQKENLIKNPKKLEEFLSDKIEIENYSLQL